jgi:hypothetical protein
MSGYALPSNGEFVTVLNACRDLGGLARAQEVASMAVSRRGANARALVCGSPDRELLSFEWQSQVWIPLFQFDRVTMVLHQGLKEILAVLSRSFGPWEQAMWFTQPNNWLDDKIPAHVLTLNHEAVARAAHANQFIALH